MKVRFTAEIIDDNGNAIKDPVAVETTVPDLMEYNCPAEFLRACLKSCKIFQKVI